MEEDKCESAEITVAASNESKSMLEEMSSIMGISQGEVIDKMLRNWSPKEPSAAAQLILEDLVTHTLKLDKRHFNRTFAIVLAAIREGLSDNDPKILKRLVSEIDELLNSDSEGNADLFLYV